MHRAWIVERIADLESRLDGIRWPSCATPSIAAGAVSQRALVALEAGAHEVVRALLASSRGLQRAVYSGSAPIALIERQIVALQLRADALFKTIDLYTDAITTRADARVAMLLAGTDVLLGDALARPVPGYSAPIAISYLDSGGRGGAINRARTRLPGGIVLPIALVRVSPESLPARLSSCLHEAGHQLSADLNLLDEGHDVIEAAALRALGDTAAARLWASWTLELLADCWNIGLSGGAPGVDGLQRLLSLPQAWLFRIIPNDPHPPGFLRSRFALALAQRWHPHGVLTALARRIGTAHGAITNEATQRVIALDGATAAVARALASHRFEGLGHRSLADACEIAELAPRQAMRLGKAIGRRSLVSQRPLLGLAALNFGRLTGRIEVRRFHREVASWLMRLAEQHYSRVPGAIGRDIAMSRGASASPRRDCSCSSSLEVLNHV